MMRTVDECLELIKELQKEVKEIKDLLKNNKGHVVKKENKKKA